MTDPEQRDRHPGRTTPEGHTPEQPALAELGQPGTPGAGLTPSVPHPADAEAVEGAGAHTGAHTGRHAGERAETTADLHPDARAADDTHGHVEPILGPIDWSAWGYAAAGAAIGLVVLALFYFALA